jgi:hypothetical protein
MPDASAQIKRCLTHEEVLQAGAECEAAALDYLSLRWSVVALCSHDHVGVRRADKKHSKQCKHPGTTPWMPWEQFQSRLPAPEEVEEWWRQLCNSNVGLALGPVSGLVCIVIDGPDGEAELQELCAGDVPETLEFTSGGENGGRSLLFRIPPGVTLRATTQQKGAKQKLRFQGEGSHAVLPHSVHASGTRYCWKEGHGPHDHDAAPMPSWLIAVMGAVGGADGIVAGQARPPKKGANRSDNPLLQGALQCARRGWRVIPLHHVVDGVCTCGEDCGTSKGKHPRTAHGLKDGATDAETICGWWERWPSANVGVCTGQASGVWMLGPDGAKGIDDLAELERQHGPLPRTPKAQSGSGGRHYYFSWPANGGVINRKNHNGLAIDVRGEGGIFVAPPSRNKNGPYVWEVHPDECPLAEAPDWLLQWCRADGKETASSNGDVTVAEKPAPCKTGGSSIVDLAIAHLATLPAAISGDGGHDKTMAAAGAMVWGFNLGAEVGYQLLAEHYNPRCQPPWTEKELRHKCHDADSKPFDLPRGWLLSKKLAGRNDKPAEPGRNDQSNATSKQQAEPWPDLLPLGEPPSAPDFPVDVLPGYAADMARETSWAMNVPVDLAAVPLLVLAGGAIANSRRLAITVSHTQSGCLYAAIICPPGANKSAPVQLLRQPLELVQQQYLDEWRKALGNWENADEEKRGPRPVPKRCIVSDTTTETLSLLLMQNPRGVLLAKDELSGLMASMNQYKGGKGDDRQIYMAMWGGETIIKDRKSEKMLQGAPIFVLNPFVAIVGTIQPDLLPYLRGEAVRGMPPPDDGWLDRFLPVFPDPLPDIGEQWRAVSKVTQAAWEDVVKKLLSLEMIDQDKPNPRPHLVKLTKGGKDQWVRFRKAHADEVNSEDFPRHLRGAWAKLRGYCARLALIIHYLRWACGEVGDKDVDGIAMERASRLIAYFKVHVRRVAALTNSDHRSEEARRVLQWIVANGRSEFTKRDAYQGLRGTFKTVEDLDAVLVTLEKHNIVRTKETPDRKGRGRKPSQIYEVHADILQIDPHNSQNSEAALNSAKKQPNSAENPPIPNDPQNSI